MRGAYGFVCFAGLAETGRGGVYFFDHAGQVLADLVKTFREAFGKFVTSFVSTISFG